MIDKLKNIIQEILLEVTVTDFFVKRVADKAKLDISRFSMKSIIKGFEKEMDLQMKLGNTPVDTLKLIISNLNKNPEYYSYQFKNKQLATETEKIGSYNYKKLSHILVVKNGVDNLSKRKIDLIKKFLIFVSDNLSLDKTCKIYLSATRNEYLETTASYNPSNDHIWIYVKNRNMLGDILRSLAHEMMHFKQKLRGELHAESGTDGSPHENEANTFSGVMIRKFGRMFPEIYE